MWEGLWGTSFTACFSFVRQTFPLFLRERWKLRAGRHKADYLTKVDKRAIGLMLPRLVAAAASGGLLSSSVMSSWWITPERRSPNNRFPKCDDGRFFQLFFSPQLTENISGLPDFWGEKWGLKGCNPGANSESTLKKALPLVSWINPLNIATFLKMSAGFSFNSLHTHTWIQNVYISHFFRTHPTLLTKAYDK